MVVTAAIHTKVCSLYAAVKRFLYYHPPVEVAYNLYLDIRSRLGKTPVCVDMLDGKFKMFTDIRNEGLSRDYYIYRIHEHLPTEIFIKTLSIIKDPCGVLDIGSHVGYYALIEATFTPCRVYAVEPNPDSYELLKKNVQINNLQNKISTYNVAMCESEGYVDFIINERPDWSYVKSLPQAKITLRSRDRNVMKIRCVTIDDFCKHEDVDKLSYIRMDVEGYELNILRGGKSILNNVERLFIEVHPLNMLRYGYSVEDFYSFLVRYDYKVKYITMPYVLSPSDNPPLITALRRFVRAKPLIDYSVYEVNMRLKDFVENVDSNIIHYINYHLFLER
ncbi:MAG: FkbM family methyltransferase [Sulfolobales archaeon]|nr:FkbM family methyltransferase [Sulfolobales archaeon]